MADPRRDGPRDDAPLTAAETLDLFGALSAFEDAQAIVLAVSGGPDSMALLHLAAGAATLSASRGVSPPRLIVGTVDHGLRLEARIEAEAVADAARNLGFEPHRLLWTGPKPDHGLQAAARAARYALLVDLARQSGASHLATAHTRDDQAETVLFRMARGSGPAGLAGMRPRVARDGLVHIRPFLPVAKARLVAACHAAGWRFFEDPSNHDPRFARTRWRRLMPSLAQEGLNADKIVTLARRLARLQTAIDVKTEAARREACVARQPDLQLYDLPRLLHEPDAILIRLLEQALTDFVASGPPRLARLEALAEALRKASVARQPFRSSLHGALVSVLRTGILEIAPAPPRRRGLVSKSSQRQDVDDLW